MREREEDFQQEPLEGTEEDLSGKKMGVWFEEYIPCELSGVRILLVPVPAP